MMLAMKDIDFTGKTVFDFGTGTGILAILAEKLGAEKVYAVDNDDWSIANSRENVLQNSCTAIEIEKADTAQANSSFNIILANINKNVIMDNFSALAKQMARGGVLIISGLLTTDEMDIVDKAAELGLRVQHKAERHNWLCLNMTY
jgi:ribosomal protein L11 methyltransferase